MLLLLFSRKVVVFDKAEVQLGQKVLVRVRKWFNQADSMKIREFRLVDYSSVFELWKEAGLEIRPGDDLAGVKLKLERDPDLFLVAEEAGQIIGSVIGGWDGRRGFLWHLATKAGYQRKGIGRALVRQVEERLRKKGAAIVYAMILTTNQRSRDFFTASGYKTSDDQVVVRKDLRKSRA